MQTTLLGFAIALILALLAALVGPYFVDWNQHRALFEAEASRLVGLNVRVAGDIDARILPFPSVTLREIAIGPAELDNGLRARTLRVELGLGPLLRGEIRAVEMRLIAPQVRVGLDRDGKPDWPPIAVAAETLAIDRLSVEDGRVTLTDAASGARMVLDQLWFAGEVRSLAGPVRGKGEFVTSGGLYGYDVSASRQGQEGVRIKLGLKTSERPLTVDVEGLLSFKSAAPSFEGTFALARPAGAELATGKAVGYEPWRLNAKFSADAAAASLEEVSFQYGPDERAVALSGTGAFTFGANPHLQARLTARQVDLDRLLATPQAPRRTPLSAVQALGEMLGGALRPSWPIGLSLAVDAATLGGGALQGLAGTLRSDGAVWTLDHVQFRAPGFTKFEARGRLHPTGNAIGFVGGASVESGDPKNLLAWLAGGTAVAAQIKPWNAKGDITLAADRIAIERLETGFERSALKGSVVYFWPAGSQPARLQVDLRAGELDLDAVVGFGQSALGGLGLEWPREGALSFDVGRARLNGVDAHNIAAHLALDSAGLAIERLSIGNLGGASFEAKGRVQAQPQAAGNITVDLKAGGLDGAIALAEGISPRLAGPLRRLARVRQAVALRATLSLGDDAGGSAGGRIGLSGQVGAIRVQASAAADGMRGLSFADLPALAQTDVRLAVQLDSDGSAPLLALLGLDRFAGADAEPARLTVSADGPLSRPMRFEGKLAAGPIDAGGRGTLRLPSDLPGALDLDRFSGTIGGHDVSGRLAFGFGDTMRVDGAVETAMLDAPATIAAAIGMPRPDGTASDWSSEPFSPPLGVTGRIDFKAQRAAFSSALTVERLRGVARFAGSEIFFEDVVGELGKGRLESRLAFAKGADGLSARVRVALRDADAAAILINGERPPVAGRLALQVELESSGRSPAAFVGSFTGFGNVTLRDARFAGLNPDVFGVVTRAAELEIPINGNRLGEFVRGVLDSADLSVPQATAEISIAAGQARLRDISVKAVGADIELVAGASLADGNLDALLTLTGEAPAPGAPRPSLLVALRGPLDGPSRTVDARSLTSWLTLRQVERHSRQLDAIERATRESGAGTAAKPAAPTAQSSPAAAASEPTPSGAAGASSEAPALPPPVEVPASPKPRALVRPPGLIGAQN